MSDFLRSRIGKKRRERTRLEVDFPDFLPLLLQLLSKRFDLLHRSRVLNDRKEER